MQIVQMQCPACGAPLTIVTDARITVCSFCRTQLAVVGSASQPQLRPTTLPSAPASPPNVTQLLRMGAVSNRRGCLWAAGMWFFGGPLVVVLLFLPLALLLPTDESGQVQLPDALALCIGILFFALPLALTLYAFVHFRQRGNGFLGFMINPVRSVARRLQR